MRIALISAVTALAVGSMVPTPSPVPATHHHRGPAICWQQHDHPPHDGHWAARAPLPRYDTRTEETLQARVLEVERVTHRSSDQVGVHLRVELGGREALVHLGPESFLERRGLAPEAGMTLEITGSWVDHDGERIVLARKVVHEDSAFELRDPEGRPLWARGPGRR